MIRTGAVALAAALLLAPSAHADITDSGTTWFLGGGRTANSPSEMTIEQARDRLADLGPNPRIDAVIQFSRDGVHTGRPFGAAVREGTANAFATVRPGDTIIGYSLGAAVAQQLKKILAQAPDDPAVPGPDYEFITFGDPTNNSGGEMPFMRRHFINMGDLLPPLSADDDTVFTTTTVAQEYDRIADFPDHAWNLVAVWNSLLSAKDHLGYRVAWADTTDAQRAEGVHRDDTQERVRIITTQHNSKGGTNIHVLVKSDTLPLTRWLRIWSWTNPVIDTVDVPLRWLIDAGYTGHR
ncbi:PE-PPE domain-containing protein [Mycobacterium sp. C31M]